MDLRERVQQSLSGTHTIERELGGGGMSRVFVAREQRLGRTVKLRLRRRSIILGVILHAIFEF